MRLSDLAEATGVSAASIKYYRREGLLPPGRHVTATRQDYGRRHVERLQLIQVLRELLDAPIPRIARLTAILDDPQRPLLDALAEAQTIMLGTDSEEAPERERPEHPSLAPLLEQLGWPDVPSSPRAALDEVLHLIESWGVPTHIDLLSRYAEPIAQIAAVDLELMQRMPDPAAEPTTDPAADAAATTEPTADAEGRSAGEDQPSADAIVLRSVAGAIAYDRLLRGLRFLGHASLSMIDPLTSAGGEDPSTDPGAAQAVQESGRQRTANPPDEGVQ